MNWKQFYELCMVRVKFGFVSQANDSRMGYLWWGIEPIIQIAAYYLVFGVLLISFKGGNPVYSGTSYVGFLVCGVVPWTAFSRAANHSVTSISRSGWLIKNIDIHKIYFPLTSFIQDYIKSSVMFILMMLLIILIGFEPTLSWLYMPIIFVVQGIFTLSICIWLASITPFQPDLKLITPLVFQVMMFTSGIFFDRSSISPDLQDIFFMNPLALLIDTYRIILLGADSGGNDIVSNLLRLFIISIVLLVSACWFLSRKNDAYSRALK